MTGSADHQGLAARRSRHSGRLLLGVLAATAQLLLPKMARAQEVVWLATRGEENRSLFERFSSSTTWSLRLLLVIATALVIWRVPVMWAQAKRLRRVEWLLLTLCMATAAALRMVGGVRVPGFTSAAGHAHGYGLLREVLVWDPLRMDPHGNGFHALYGLVVSVLPAWELTIVALQLTLSVLTVLLTYVVARLWLRDRGWALGSAAVMAVLPSQVYFATTEIRLLPGTALMLLTLATCGLAIRRQDPLLLLAAAFWGGLTVHFYPTLLPLPLVLFCFMVAQKPAPAFRKSTATWFSAALLLALWAVPATRILWLIATKQGSVIGADFLKVFGQADKLLSPSFELAGPDSYNVFLNAEITPPPLWLLAAVGLWVGVRRRSSRFATGCALGSALLFTLVGMFPGRLNFARLQLVAGPFYAMLAGAGLSFVATGAARALRRNGTSTRTLAATVVLAGSVALWPGPIGQHYTLQWERQVFLDGLPTIRDGCTVIWAPCSHGILWDVPVHLAEERGRKIRFGAIPPGFAVPQDLSATTRCVVYYRSSMCFTLNQDEQRAEALRPECARIEEQLELSELFVRTVPAKPDDMVEYGAERLPLGFYAVVALVPPPRVKSREEPGAAAR